jgi:hypothetical protein
VADDHRLVQFKPVDKFMQVIRKSVIVENRVMGRMSVVPLIRDDNIEAGSADPSAKADPVIGNAQDAM